jgi:hypothetical protein
MADTTYPVTLQIERPETSSRMWALFNTFIPIKGITLIINIIMLYIFMIGVGVVFFISQLIVLFTGKYPQGMHKFVVQVMGWQMQVGAFMYGLRDEFPPFAPSDAASAVKLTIPYPEKSSRGWAIMTMLGLKSLALFPVIIVLYIFMIGVAVVFFISQLIVLFTGKFPEGMHAFMVKVMRWMVGISAFMYGLTDEYPPFSPS